MVAMICLRYSGETAPRWFFKSAFLAMKNKSQRQRVGQSNPSLVSRITSWDSAIRVAGLEVHTSRLTSGLWATLPGWEIITAG